MSWHQTEWDAVIVNYNASLFLDPCLRALEAISHKPQRVIVVDNASTDDSLTELAAWPSVEAIALAENLGYSGGANRGVEASSSPLVVVLNPDVELASDYGDRLVEAFEADPQLGAAGAKLLFPDSDLIQHAGGVVNWPELTTAHRGHGEKDTGQFAAPEDVSYVTGAAIAIRRTAFDAVGGFDESFYPAYWEDVDLCWRVRQAGWSVRYEPGLIGVHHEAGGADQSDSYFEWFGRNRLLMAARYMANDEWWRDFVPAEMSRLRGELQAVDSAAWPERSGAASIERLARVGRHLTQSMRSEIRGARLLDSIESIRPLAELADPARERPDERRGLAESLKRFLGRFSGRIYAEEIYWNQRQFNESLVRALQAQDRLNRELVAELLLALLIQSRPESKPDSGSNHSVNGSRSND